REFTYTFDETTIPFLVQLFPKKTENEDLQKKILQTLTKFKTAAAFDAFFQLAPSFRKTQYDGYAYQDVFDPFMDTLDLAARYLPQILELNKHRAFSYYSDWLVYKLLRADVLDRESALLAPDRFLARAEALLEKHQLLQVDSLVYFDDYYQLDALHVIIGELESTPATQQYLAKAQQLYDTYLLATIMDGMMMNGQTIERATFDRLFTEPYSWYRLLNNASVEKSLDRIPKDLFQQNSTVQAYVAQDIQDNFDQLRAYELLETRPHHTVEGDYLLYLYRFEIRGYEGAYLGLCSQPADPTKVNVYPQYYYYSTVQLEETNRESITQSILDQLAMDDAKEEV
ncbi:MAG: hypothetical protein AAGD05_19775, partial [Bacteroidota bacterium]